MGGRGLPAWAGLLVAVVAWAAAAQRSELLAFLAREPLHARVADADVVAIGRIEAVEFGRLRVADARVLRGAAGESFEIKRAPSNPPPLREGDRALLLLRGARAPYLLVDRAEEVAAFADAAAEARIGEALRALLAADQDPRRLSALYLSWLDGRSPELQREAILGLDDRTAGFHPLPPPALGRLVAFASNPRVAPELRRAAAFSAGRSAAGRADLDPDLGQALRRLTDSLY